MELRDQLLLEFEAAYRRMEKVRAGGDDGESKHAERNFYACAEALAKRVPMLVESDD